MDALIPIVILVGWWLLLAYAGSGVAFLVLLLAAAVLFMMVAPEIVALGVVLCIASLALKVLKKKLRSN